MDRGATGIGFKGAVEILGLGVRGDAMVDVVGLWLRGEIVEIEGLGLRDMFEVGGIEFSKGFGFDVEFRGVAVVNNAGLNGAGAIDKPTVDVGLTGVVTPEKVEAGLSGVFTEGVLVSVFMVTVVIVSEMTRGPVEQGGGEMVLVIRSGNLDFLRLCQFCRVSCVVSR